MNNIFRLLVGLGFAAVAFAFTPAYADVCEVECSDDEPYCGDLVVDPGEQCDDGNDNNGDGCSAVCTIEGGDEGCTPGFWKQSHHFGNWPAPYTPDTPFGAVFEDAYPGMTLRDVLWQGGGVLNALGRHAVAALLNGANDDVNYALDDSAVIARFNEVYPTDKRYEYNRVKNGFEELNEMGCPLSRFGRNVRPELLDKPDMVCEAPKD